LELILVQNQSSASGYPVFPEAFVEEVVFSPLCVLGSYVEDQLAIDAWIYVWMLYSDPLVFLCVLCKYLAVVILAL
jgi:hypothetical protein